jgi:hypothetical protein
MKPAIEEACEQRSYRAIAIAIDPQTVGNKKR